eukprot:UN21764
MFSIFVSLKKLKNIIIFCKLKKAHKHEFFFFCKFSQFATKRAQSKDFLACQKFTINILQDVLF